MDKSIREFGKRMDTAEDKLVLVDYAEGFKSILDLALAQERLAEILLKSVALMLMQLI